MHPEVSMTLDLRSEGILSLTKWSDNLKANLVRGIARAGKYAEKELKNYFRGRPGNKYGNFGKSYDYRLRVRSGALRSSISSIMQSGATGPQAKIGPAFLYGAYNEFGARIPVTPKMRIFLGRKYGVWLKKSTMELILPARPWFFPTIEKAKPGILNEVRLAIDAPLRS